MTFDPEVARIIDFHDQCVAAQATVHLFLSQLHILQQTNSNQGQRSSPWPWR